MVPQDWVSIVALGATSMGDVTTLLFGLEGFRVVTVMVEQEQNERDVLEPGKGVREVVVKGLEGEQTCPDCGVLSGMVHVRKIRRITGLPHGRRPLRVWWHQRRWAGRAKPCRRRTCAETSVQVGAGNRLTLRLREQLELAVSGSTRSAADVAREFRVSWWSVNHAPVVAAASMTPQLPAGVPMLGVDQTRSRSVRWLLVAHGWRRSDPWMTSFVDLDPTHPGGLLGLAPGRSGASVRGGLDLQCEHFRDGIEVVAVDPSAPFAAALGDVLPHAALVVKHWHLHRLANLMHTQVRQRVTQQIHGHRGRLGNDSWAYCRLLLRGARHLSDKQWRRLREQFGTDDPTGQIQAARAGKELLRPLPDALPAVDGPLVIAGAAPPTQPRATVSTLRPDEIRARLRRFHDLAATAGVPELERSPAPCRPGRRRPRPTCGCASPTPGPGATTARPSRSSACRAASVTISPTNDASCGRTPRPQRDDHRAKPTPRSTTKSRQSRLRPGGRAVYTHERPLN